MTWWDKVARELQSSVHAADVNNENNIQHSEQDASNATVYTRLDMVLVASYLSSANKQLRTIKWFLAVIIILLIIIAGNLDEINNNM